jgi:hypothetical protein
MRKPFFGGDVLALAALILALAMIIIGAVTRPAPGQVYSPAMIVQPRDGCLPGQACSGSVNSAAVVVSVDTTGAGSIVWHITSAGTSCTSSFETSNDGTNWVSQQFYALPTGSVTAATTTAGIFVAPAIGRYARLRVSTYGGGTVAANVFLRSGVIGTGF